ncbi:MAG: hypothetical protein L0Y54_17270 [Sporichthyaceae bacterium]|nr:hypothetical protein [Sporichthyaceae bacterium]
MRARLVLPRLLICGTLLVVGGVAAIAQASPAAAGSCSKQTGVSVTDPNTGWSWTSRWWCGNRGGARMYGDANYTSHTAYMDSTWSWVVCYRRGAHSGGSNNVWYYTLGDRTSTPYKRPNAWGYLPAGDVWTDIDPWPGIPACPISQSPPTRVDGMNKPVYFVHGYSDNGSGWNCNGTYWDDAIADYLNDGSPARLGPTPLGRKWTYSYYSTSLNYGPGACDLVVPGDRSKPIKTLGLDFAWEVWDHYSQFGIPVDAVGHSMGGLVIRAALTGVQRHEAGWPPYLYIEDVSTLSTPHRGAPLGGVCKFSGQGTQQCKDMAGSSTFMSWLYDNPQSAMGTDWTLIGFDDDFIVPKWSAVPTNMAVGHKIVYPDGQITPAIDAHMLQLWRTSGTYTIRYCDYFSTGCSMSNWESFYTVTGSYDPIRMARYGNYYWNIW